MQLNILQKEFFLKDLLDQTATVYQLSVDGIKAVNQIERLMQYWQSQVLLAAQKDAEMLFTDEQLSALANLKKQVELLERQLDNHRGELEDLDARQRSLIDNLLKKHQKDAGSQLLAAALADFWRQLIEVRTNYVEKRLTSIVDFVTNIKNNSARPAPASLAV
ncbi:hypothetical protein FWH30_02555 [Microgenomates group bacterium]|nr:hypothetical protein [Microgenomates group bacterium]